MRIGKSCCLLNNVPSLLFSLSPSCLYLSIISEYSDFQRENMAPKEKQNKCTQQSAFSLFLGTVASCTLRWSERARKCAAVLKREARPTLFIQ